MDSPRAHACFCVEASTLALLAVRTCELAASFSSAGVVNGAAVELKRKQTSPSRPVASQQRGDLRDLWPASSRTSPNNLFHILGRSRAADAESELRLRLEMAEVCRVKPFCAACSDIWLLRLSKVHLKPFQQLFTRMESVHAQLQIKSLGLGFIRGETLITKHR